MRLFFPICVNPCESVVKFPFATFFSRVSIVGIVSFTESEFQF